MTGRHLVISTSEATRIGELAAESKSKIRTWNLVRDTSQILYVLETSGKLTRVTPVRETGANS